MALCFSILSSEMAVAAEKFYSFSDYACDYSFRYDPAKYPKDQVDNTVKLIFSLAAFPDLMPALKEAPDAYINFDFAKYNQVCTNSVTSMAQLKFIQLPGIEDYRRMFIEQAKDLCEFTNVEMHGFTNPGVLRDYEPAAKACSVFVDALEGGTDLKIFYRHAAEAQCREIGSPD